MKRELYRRSGSPQNTTPMNLELGAGQVQRQALALMEDRACSYLSGFNAQVIIFCFMSTDYHG